MKMKLLASLLLIPLALAPARADQNDPRLDGLFDELRSLEDPVVANAVEYQIWQYWLQSRNAAVNLLMRTGVGAMERQDYPGALISFDRITTMAPDFAAGGNERATLLFLLGRRFGALAGRGHIFMKLERYDLARDAFEKALAINPHAEGARQSLDRIQNELDRGRI